MGDFWQGLGSIGADVVNGITSIFGVDIRKYMKKNKKYQFLDYTSALKAINTAFGQLEISSAQKLNEIQKRLDALIQMPNSPVIRNFIGKIKTSLNSEYSKIQKQQAAYDLKKTEAQTLANDLDAASLGDYISDEFKEKANRMKEKVSEAIEQSNDPSKTKQEVTSAPGWENIEKRL